MSVKLSPKNSSIFVLLLIFFVRLLCFLFSGFTQSTVLSKPVDAQNNRESTECHTLPLILGVQAPLCVKVNDELVSKAVRDGGVWERGVLTMVLRALSKYPSTVLIDGGANVGEYTVMAAALGREVVAVEPMVDNIQAEFLMYYN